MITIYHNNRCGKSRSALSLLEESGQKFQTVEYLKDIPTIEDLKAIIKKLKIKPHDLIRTKEAIYLENYKGKDLTDEPMDTSHARTSDSNGATDCHQRQ
jgi:arsenate reductase